MPRRVCEAYAWPHYDSVPFSLLAKPLAACRVACDDGEQDQARKSLRDGQTCGDVRRAADPPPEKLFTDDLSWDKAATHTGDVDSFLPVRRLAEYAASGRIGSASPRFYGAPPTTAREDSGANRTPHPRVVPRDGSMPCSSPGFDRSATRP